MLEGVQVGVNEADGVEGGLMVRSLEISVMAERVTREEGEEGEVVVLTAVVMVQSLATLLLEAMAERAVLPANNWPVNAKECVFL